MVCDFSFRVWCARQNQQAKAARKGVKVDGKFFESDKSLMTEQLI
jgi:hypothetical protein